MADYFTERDPKSKPRDEPVPPGCVLLGAVPNPKGKKPLTQSERDHVAHFHSAYGGSINIGWFLRLNLPLTVQKLLSYPESCLIVSEEGDTVGKLFTSLTTSAWGEQKCMLLHSGSYAKIKPGVEVGTSLTGFLTPDLKVIQELCHEWCRYEGVMFDRKTFLMHEQTGLYGRIILKRDEEVKMEKTFKIPYNNLQTFVSEAANIVLHRLIIQQKKSGEMYLSSLTNQGNIVRSNYRVLGTGYENVKGEEIQVWGIRRTVFCENEVQCWDSLFNYYGCLVLRCQPDNDHAMVPLWFRPVEDLDEFGVFIGMRPPIVWACDAELHSKYLIRKTQLAAEYKTYLMDHPEVRALLSDFMQKLLLAKPRNILEFSEHFFQPFLIARPESEEVEEESESSKSSSSQASFGEGGEGGWEGEGAERHKKYGFLNLTSRPYQIEDYFTDDPDGFILAPRAMTMSQEDLGLGGEEDGTTSGNG